MENMGTMWMYLYAEFAANAQWNHVIKQCALSQQVRHKQVWKCFTAVDLNQNENASISNSGKTPMLAPQQLKNLRGWYTNATKKRKGGADMQNAQSHLSYCAHCGCHTPLQCDNYQ